MPATRDVSHLAGNYDGPVLKVNTPNADHRIFRFLLNKQVVRSWCACLTTSGLRLVNRRNTVPFSTQTIERPRAEKPAQLVSTQTTPVRQGNRANPAPVYNCCPQPTPGVP